MIPEKSNQKANCDLDDWMELESKNPVSFQNVRRRFGREKNKIVLTSAVPLGIDKFSHSVKDRIMNGAGFETYLNEPVKVSHSETTWNQFLVI